MVGDPPQAFTRFAGDLDVELRKSLPSAEHLPRLFGMLRYHLGWEDAQFQPSSSPAGKRLRPTLCLLSCESVGCDYRKALPAAAAVELIHNFSLIHDDIEDRSAERRHRLTVWKLWGEPQGVNAGDTLFAIAFRSVHRLSELGHDPIVVLEAARLLSESCISLCEGQYLDIEFEHRLDVSEDEYYQMIAGKTAALISCSTQLGALVGCGSVVGAEPVRRFGLQLGFAFQVQDDILGIWGDSRQTGKPRGDDIRQRKKTLPIIYALSRAGESEQSQLRAVLTGSGEVPASAVDQVTRILERAGAREYANNRAEEHLAKAVLELDGMKPQLPAVREMREVAASLLGRQT